MLQKIFEDHIEYKNRTDEKHKTQKDKKVVFIKNR